jgi:hypothetical protein
MRNGWGRQKPPLGTPIQWGHPLARGLLRSYLFTPGAVLDSVTGIRLTTSGAPGWTAGPCGPLRNYAANGDYDTDSTFPGLSPLRGYSIIGRFRATTVDGNWRPLVHSQASGGDRALFLGLSGGYNSTSNSWVFFPNDAADSAAYSGTAIVAGQWYDFALTRSGAPFDYIAGVSSMYLDGVLGSRSTTGSSIDLGVAPLNIGRDTSNNFQFLGDVSELHFWDRELSITEIQNWRTNPFAMFAPPSPALMVWFGEAGAPPSFKSAWASGSNVLISGAF